MSGRAFWVVHPDGTCRRLGDGGILVGRGPDCDIVVADERASRHHAIVHHGSRGPEVVPMGINPTRVNGRRVDGPVALAHGDRVAVPGLTLRVRGGAGPVSEAASRWALVHPGGAVYGIAHVPFSVGGANDDLSVRGWPDGALRLYATDATLLAEARCELLRDGVPLPRRELVALPPGAVIGHGDVALTVVAQAGTASGSTVHSACEDLPCRVQLAYRARGGRLRVRVGGADRELHLSEQRCDLVAVLLDPPGTLRAGDYVQDEVLIPLVWPRDPSKGRVELNTLIHRARQDLARAGIDSLRVLERAPGGGATRFAVAEGAEVGVTFA